MRALHGSLLVLLLLTVAWAEEAKPPSAEDVARAFLREGAAGEFEAARARLDEAMLSALPPGALPRIWSGLKKRAGEVEAWGEATKRGASKLDVVDVECVCEKAVLVLRVVVDREQRVAGFFVMQQRPRTADPAAVTLETPTGTLYGTVDLPEGEGLFPAVLLIAGSGPTDRDGNGAGLVNDHLKRLGKALAEKGIAVLRYDKRGVAGSAAAGPREEDLRIETYAADAAAWVKQMRADERFSTVAIVGHSEGSLVGMLAAKQERPDAFVSLAGPGRPAAEVLKEQLEGKLPEALRRQSDVILAELVAGRTVDDVPPGLVSLYRRSVQPYLISWMKYDPAEVLATLEGPVYVLQGTTDLQVGAEDAERLRGAREGIRHELLVGMNHVLREARTQEEQNRAYMDASRPLFPGLAPILTAFLRPPGAEESKGPPASGG